MTIKLTYYQSYEPKVGDRIRLNLRKDDGIYKILNNGCGNITGT